MKTFETHESEVRSYCRSFPTIFEKAQGSCLFDRQGRRYIDFFAGAGALNYGHNPAPLQEALMEYIQAHGITHSLDMATGSKEQFLETFHKIILEPRGMQYKMQFPGPTGTNAVETALKLARKVTGRHSVICFTNSFHGMTLGSLSVTGNSFKREGAGVPLHYGVPMPFDGCFSDEVDTLNYLESYLENGSSGVDLPAAIILETVQAEGGVNVARFDWLSRLSKLAKRFGILLVVDDIQVGCGRTGPFFSFEKAPGFEPDIICLSKSLSGYGLPFAMVLFRPELDLWEPGEHNGTFRGNNLAFVTARAALEHYWKDQTLTAQVARKAKIVHDRLRAMAEGYPGLKAAVRGRGLIQGLCFPQEELAGAISRRCFEKGLVIETAGPQSEVLKVLCPLTIPDAQLLEGLDIVDSSIREIATRTAERTLAGVAG